MVESEISLGFDGPVNVQQDGHHNPHFIVEYFLSQALNHFLTVRRMPTPVPHASGPYAYNISSLVGGCP